MELEQRIPLTHYQKRAIGFKEGELREMFPHDVLLVYSTGREDSSINFGSTIKSEQDESSQKNGLEATVYHLIKPENFQVVTVGRASTNPVYINHKEISRSHAFIRENPHNGLKEINDRSTNGTILDGKELPKDEWMRIKSGSELIFGSRKSGIKATYLSSENFVYFLTQEE